MPDIRYVCLSDMHLGAATSLLTHLNDAGEVDATTPSRVLEKLVACLRSLVTRNVDETRKPTLVLNGDILELALAGDDDAAMAFERFCDLIMPEGDELFHRLVYIPGNHDHHLWETARETQYAEHLSSAASCAWGQPLPFPWHATDMFKNTVRSYFLTRLVQRRVNLRSLIVETAYPNFGLVSDDGRRCVLCHHGHFVEQPMYTLMSFLKNMIFPDRPIPLDVWDLEAENFAWIDFFWSTLGRSSGVGKGVAQIFEQLQDERRVQQLVAHLAEGLAKHYDLPGWGDTIEARILEWALNRGAREVRGGLERNIDGEPLSQAAREGLRAYVEKHLRRQFLAEDFEAVPSYCTFIFGHTHKPFQEVMIDYAGYGRVDVYNSGGWVVDRTDRQPHHGGAVILVDEDLHATSLRMYNEALASEGYAVRVEEARVPGDVPSAFHRRIEQLVQATPEPWRAFSAAAAEGVSVRAQALQARINRRSV